VRSKRRAPILIADDDPATLEGLTEFLAEFGYRVVPFRNGQEIMDLLLSGVVPALFILDLAMPHVAGDELLRYLQTDPILRFVPVIVVTGAPERLGRGVADAVLPKPVNLSLLLAHVNRLASGPRSRPRDEESLPGNKP
jgi:two-component system cell cycle response regulator DivK